MLKLQATPAMHPSSQVWHHCVEHESQPRQHNTANVILPFFVMVKCLLDVRRHSSSCTTMKKAADENAKLRPGICALPTRLQSHDDDLDVLCGTAPGLRDDAQLHHPQYP